MTYKIGVDGGGTKTEGILVDAAGVIVARHLAPGCNPNIVGPEQARLILTDVLGALTSTLSAQPSTLSSSPIVATQLFMSGLPGFWLEVAASLKDFGHVTAALDSLPILELATHGAPGLVIHAGTGSFVAARAPDGSIHYAGGIGWRFGDPGSGYDLGRRAILNLGHTVGHGIEAAAGYDLYHHGEAISLGLLAALRVSEHSRDLAPEWRDRTASTLARHGLPVRLDPSVDVDQVVEIMSRDKKSDGRALNMVLLRAPGLEPPIQAFGTTFVLELGDVRGRPLWLQTSPEFAMKRLLADGWERTFQLARETSNRTYPEIGVPDPHHPLSHHGNDPDKIARMAKINAFHVSLFAYYLERLKATPEGDGSLLDHSLLLYGSGIGNPNIHDHTNLPVIVAGGAAGGMRGGRHLRYDNPTPLANVHLALLDKVGVRIDRFGDSSGRADELFSPVTL
mgnify:CR=1 FL=1